MVGETESRLGFLFIHLKAVRLRVSQASVKPWCDTASQDGRLHCPRISAVGGLGPKHWVSGLPDHVQIDWRPAAEAQVGSLLAMPFMCWGRVL